MQQLLEESCFEREYLLEVLFFLFSLSHRKNLHFNNPFSLLKRLNKYEYQIKSEKCEMIMSLVGKLPVSDFPPKQVTTS